MKGSLIKNTIKGYVMSLGYCPECNAEISSRATRCPKCGYAGEPNILSRLFTIAAFCLGAYGIVNWLMLQ